MAILPVLFVSLVVSAPTVVTASAGTRDEDAVSGIEETTALKSLKLHIQKARDDSSSPSARPSSARLVSYVEFVGGDRLPGKVEGCTPGTSDAWEHVPAELLVAPAVALGAPGSTGDRLIAVPTDAVLRIVSREVPPGPRRPGTAWLRNGRKIACSRVRWGHNELRLLTAGGMETIALADLAEINMPPCDPWEHYLDELARLAPQGNQMLLVAETCDRLRATVSASRLRVTTHNDPILGPTEIAVIQPAWSRQPLWVRADDLCSLYTFVPHEVPLSRISPRHAVQDSPFGSSLRWRRDSSVARGKLHSGRRTWAHGFGVHATTELQFNVPACARAFRTRVGLDRSAGDGGCAVAEIHCGNSSRKAVFRSPCLIGSQTVVDSQEISLPPQESGDRLLRLVADAAVDDSPAGADPFDIRDNVNWLEPTVLLDRAGLLSSIKEHVGRTLPPWQGWTVDAGGAATLPLTSRFDDALEGGPAFVLDMATAGRKLTFSRQVQLTGDCRWLYLLLGQVSESSPGQLEILLNGEPVARSAVPPPGNERPLLVSLEAWLGREVLIDVVYTPGSPQEIVHWKHLTLAPRKTRVRWEPINVVASRVVGTPTLVPQVDGSFFVSGPAIWAYPEELAIAAQSKLPRVTALRLEVLPDSRLPAGGPGRNSNGNFHLAHVQVTTPLRKRETIRGRYVRLQVPGPDRALRLGEVQVLAVPPSGDDLRRALTRNPLTDELRQREVLAILDTPAQRRTLGHRLQLAWFTESMAENFATQGSATQSSTHDACDAARAIDGQFPGNYSVQLARRCEAVVAVNKGESKDVSATAQEDGPWWELDLGEERLIDRVVIWNVQQYYSKNLFDGLVVSIMDERRAVTYRAEPAAEPLPALEISRREDCLIPLATAAASAYQAWGDFRVERCLAPDAYGWATGLAGEPQAAVYTFAEPMTAPDRGFVVHLHHCNGGNWQTRFGVGRFRLSATDSPPPISPEPVGIVIPPLSQSRQ